MHRTLTVERKEGPGVLPGHLFVAPEFQRYQSAAQDKALATILTVSDQGAPVACLTLAWGPHGWSAPVTGAFGGVAAVERAPAAAIIGVVEATTDWLRAEGAQASLRLAPDAFADPTAAALENALFRTGWRLSQADLNYHLPVTNPEVFLGALGETKQKEVRRLRKSGAAFRDLPASEGQRAYDVIAENRAARGYPVTMTWPQLAALATAFPDRVGFSVVERGSDVLAGAICLDVTPTYVYVFYWGEAPAVRRESPVTLLAAGLMERAQQRGAAVLDLGTSTEQSAPNAGLVAFKESLRCLTSGRRTYDMPGR